MSAPPNLFEVEQSDGTKIPIRMFGDEYYNWMETEDGYVIEFVEEDARQGWYYSKLDENGKFTASETLVIYPVADDIDIPKRLREMDPKVHKFGDERSNALSGVNSSLDRSSFTSIIKPLVFLVDFDNRPPSMPPREYTKEEFEALIFAENLTPGDAGLPSNYGMSVRDYYYEISRETLEIYGDGESIIDWRTADYDYSYYVDGVQGKGQGNGPNNTNNYFQSAAALVVEFAMEMDDEGFDFNSFDNGRGAIDVIILIVEGWMNGSDYQFWPHTWTIPNNIIPSEANTDGYLVLDGVAITKYMIVPERYYLDSSGAWKYDIHPIGTICHEMGHILGLPDLYDKSENSAAGIGEWGLMGSGNWRNQTRPTYMSAWSRYRLGFIDPVILENKMNYDLTIQPAEFSGWEGAFILPMDVKMPHEYILLENRQRFGSDIHLAGTGMLVWHIDENITDLNDDVNVNPDFYGVNLLQADGKEDLYNDCYECTDAGDPFPGSTGITIINDNTVPGLSLYNYDRNGDGTIDAGGESGIEIRSIQENSNVITCIVDIPNANGTIISYDEGNYTGDGYEDNSGLHWAGIQFEAIESNILSGIQTYIPSTNSNYYVNNYIIKIWEGWSGNKPITFLDSYNGITNWSTNGDRNGGWVDISLMSKNISLQSGNEYYIEINFDGGAYWYDKALYSSSVASGQSYYRSSEQVSCNVLNDGDWNLRAIIGGCGADQDVEVWPGNTDANSIVDAADIVPIGIYWGMSGCSRSGDAYLWVSNPQPTGWEDPCAAHADANGDGIVDIADVLVMLVNWGEETSNSDIVESCSDIQDLTSHRDNFYQIYQSLDGNSEIEISIRSHLDELFNFGMLPNDFQLSPNFPNPFNAATQISFSIPVSEAVQIAVYDVLGRELQVLLDSPLTAGDYVINWVADDYASGIYIIHMQTAGFIMTQKAILLK